MKTSVVILICAAILGAALLVAYSSGTMAGNAGGDPQTVVLNLQNGNYHPNTITVKAGQPVRISLDSSVQGCLRSFTVPAFGVSKYLASPTDYVEFIPTQKGTFQFQCSMGMGKGMLVVE